MKKNYRIVHKIEKDKFLYLNTLGERIEIHIGKEECKESTKYYYEFEGNAALNTCNVNEWEVNEGKNVYFTSDIGEEKGYYTDICNSPSSAILALNNYYKKYGYPDEKEEKDGSK